ncbi:ParB/RepB/Spo0J family partition protein [Rhodoblastus acidophilus]|uniref:ParB/RepB/Spo0J family partition protein n=1 Tax=Rhodoblastus acidophilus TaxID=1074 RepID=UPI000DAD7842|nr:ParB/RepB/Spo0J family partition protein [Rhodoblastus acidophilus]RAI16544.1 hypothetical protein CH337_20815 [Rhodoblastus acidophilus]
MRLVAEMKIPFAQINGLSPHNVRIADPDDDYTSLAATIDAVGQIKPLAVHGDALGGYWVIDGGRRWNAQALRVQLGRLAPEAEEIPAKIYEGSPAELAELSTAASLQKQLHPVEEFEAFARLDAAGLNADAIAKDFGLTLRHVRQRLALGRMATPIREAWRDGKINREAAEAYCELGDAADQEALFSELARINCENGAYGIRERARRNKVSAADPIARFVGLDAYARAGGAIRETLFDTDEEKLLIDGALLKRLAREKLAAEAEKVRAEEGWGFVVIHHEPDEPRWRELPERLDFTKTELARIEEIEATLTAYGSPEQIALDREAAEIERKAILRKFSKARRKDLGIVAEIADCGDLLVTRAVEIIPDATAHEPVLDSPRGPAPQSTSYEAAPLEHARIEIEAPPTKGAGEIVNAAASEALAGVAATCGNFALALLVARLGSKWGADSGVEITGGMHFHDRKSELLQQIAHEMFAPALKICAAASLADLSVAAFEVISAHIRPKPDAIGKTTADMLAVATQFADVRKRLFEAMDFEAYFKACHRDDAFELFEQHLGASEVAAAKKLKKAQIVEKAAHLAKDKGWLPSAFAAIPAQPEPEPEPDPVPEPGSLPDLVARFIELFVDRDAGGLNVEYSYMDNAFYAFNKGQGGEIYEPREVHVALRKAGLNFRCIGQEELYLDCALKDCNVAAPPAPKADSHPSKPGRTASVEVATFISEQCVRGDDITEPTPAKEIYAAYTRYCEAKGWLAMTNAAFGQEIAALGVEKIKQRAGTAYIGLGLPCSPRPVTSEAAE